MEVPTDVLFGQTGVEVVAALGDDTLLRLLGAGLRVDLLGRVVPVAREVVAVVAPAVAAVAAVAVVPVTVVVVVVVVAVAAVVVVVVVDDLCSFQR